MLHPHVADALTLYVNFRIRCDSQLFVVQELWDIKNDGRPPFV